MRGLAFLSGMTLLCSLAACGQDTTHDKGQWPVSRSELERGSKPAEHAGATTYRQYCIGCHGVDGRGNGAITGADFLAATSPLLIKNDQELLISVRDGKRGTTATMPPHKPVLTDAQIAAVVAYVRQQFKPSVSTQTPSETP